MAKAPTSFRPGRLVTPTFFSASLPKQPMIINGFTSTQRRVCSFVSPVLETTRIGLTLHSPTTRVQ